jgi:hypothetical protein
MVLSGKLARAGGLGLDKDRSIRDAMDAVLAYAGTIVIYIFVVI